MRFLLPVLLLALSNLVRASQPDAPVQQVKAILKKIDHALSKRDHQQLSKLYNQALQISHKANLPDYSIMICVDLAELHNQINKPLEAVAYANRALRYYRQAKDRSVRRLFMVHYALAMAYNSFPRIDSARNYFDLCGYAIKTQPDSLRAFNLYLDRYYTERAYFEYDLMAYHESILLSQESIRRFYSKYKTTDNASTFNSLGRSYLALGQFAKADSAFRRSADIYLRQRNDPFAAIVLNNLAASKIRQNNDLKAARAVLREAEQTYARYARTISYVDTDVLRRLKQNKAGLLAAEGNVQAAIRAFDDLLSFANQHFRDPVAFRVDAYLSLSQLHQREGSAVQVRQSLDQAVREALGPGNSDWEKAALPRSLVTALIAKANYLSTAPAATPAQRRTDALAALTSYENAIDLVAMLRRGAPLAESKAFLARQAADLFVPALLLCYELSKQPGGERAIERAFVLFDRKSNSLLSDAQLETRVMRQYLPQPLQTEFQTLSRRLSQLRLLRGEGNTSISSELAATEKNLVEWQSQIAHSYPEYSRALRSASQLSKNDYQQQLATDELLLCYAPTPKGLLVLTLDRDGFTFRRVPVAPELLNHAITHYRDEVSRDPNIVGAYDERPGRELYKLLLAPVQDRLQRATALSILAPAEWGVPFEALQNAAGRMLIHDADVVYQFNLSGRLLNHNDVSSARHAALSMAPFGADTSQGPFRMPTGYLLKPLRGSAEESTHLGGLRWAGRKATKRQFLIDAPNAKTFLLTTHTFPGERETALVFHPSSGPTMNHYLLYPSELQHADFRRVELANYSACSTEKGAVRVGDGVHSIGRASAWAGARSVTCSWFPINDDAQAVAGRFFYPILSNGQTIRQNLRQARLAFLASEEGRRFSGHPYYWAGIALYGGHEALSGSTPDWQLWAIGAVACLLMAVGGIALRQKSPARLIGF